jgi:hypothetical protein
MTAGYVRLKMERADAEGARDLRESSGASTNAEAEEVHTEEEVSGMVVKSNRHPLA